MNTMAYISHPQCLDHEMLPEHPERPARVRVIAQRLVVTGLMDHLDAFETPPATDAQLTACHAQQYLDTLQSSAPKRGMLPLDEDTFLTPKTLRSARLAAGAVVLATDLILQGKYQRAFCNVRPPGHHACRTHAGGFCFFNNVAVGVRHALAQGIQRIVLLDFDVHHGNGSEEMFAGEQRVLMLSTFSKALYPYPESTPLSDNIINVILPRGADGKALRRAVNQHWLRAVEKFQPELIFVSAGFDAHCQDILGNMKWTVDDYRWLTQQIVAMAKQHSQGRIISVLEGGYNLVALAQCAALHVQGLLELTVPI